MKNTNELKANLREYDVYLRDFHNTIVEHNHSNNLKDKQRCIKKAAYLGVKSTITRPKSEESNAKASNNFRLTETILMSLARLKPVEFLVMFPIGAGYEDEYKVNDYLDVIDFINSLDPLRPIRDNIYKILRKYKNMDITLFNMKMISYLEDVRNSRGQSSTIERFLKMNYSNADTETEREYPPYLREIR